MSLELAPLPQSPSARKRRRRHLVVDGNIMISKAEMKRNLQTGKDLCKPLVSLKGHGPNFGQKLWSKIVFFFNFAVYNASVRHF